MKISPPLRFALSDRLIILRQLDSLRKWESLDDQRFCRGCHRFISGRQIEVIKGTRPNKQLRLVCPTDGCVSSTEDWAYPNEIANPPDGWGRRAIHVMDNNGRDLSSAENGRVIPGATISTISASFDASRLRVTHPRSKTWPRKSSPFYRCSGCDDTVGGPRLGCNAATSSTRFGWLSFRHLARVTGRRARATRGPKCSAALSWSYLKRPTRQARTGTLFGTNARRAAPCNVPELTGLNRDLGQIVDPKGKRD
jgi:hypothetical protein